MLSKTNQTSFNWTLRLDANRNCWKTFAITITTGQAEGGDRSSTRPSRLRGHGDGWRKTTTGAPSSPIAPSPSSFQPFGTTPYLPTQYPSTPLPMWKRIISYHQQFTPCTLQLFLQRLFAYQYCVTLLWLWIFLIVIWSWNIDVSWKWSIAHARTFVE